MEKGIKAVELVETIIDSVNVELSTEAVVQYCEILKEGTLELDEKAVGLIDTIIDSSSTGMSAETILHYCEILKEHVNH